MLSQALLLCSDGCGSRGCGAERGLSSPGGLLPWDGLFRVPGGACWSDPLRVFGRGSDGAGPSVPEACGWGGGGGAGERKGLGRWSAAWGGAGVEVAGPFQLEARRTVQSWMQRQEVRSSARWRSKAYEQVVVGGDGES